MGGGPGYLIPAPYTGTPSSWGAHQRRVPPSSEPGTDYYMPIGTPLRSPVAGRIIAIGGGLAPATGRFTLIDDGTRWLRFLHLSSWELGSQRDIEQGEVFGLSGASGYGSEFFGASHVNDAAMIARTGGPHVHVTAFKGRAYTFGSTGTIDFHALTGGVVAGGSSSPSLAPDEGDSMSYAMRVAGDPQRGPVEITPGFRPNPLNDEEFANYYAGKTFVCSDRQYDVNLARALRLMPNNGACFMGKGASPDRPWTLIAPGYIFPYPAGTSGDELRANQPFTSVMVAGNDRQYDLWIVQALTGKLPRIDATVDLPDDLSIDADLSDADVARIAKAARAEFGTNPLK